MILTIETDLTVTSIFTAETVADPYADWVAIHFPGETQPDRIAPDADPDGDGVVNLLEYAFATDPDSPSSLPISIQAQENRLNLTFTRHRSELIYTVEVSGDLINWSVISTNPGTIGQSTTIVDNQDITSAHPRYIRLGVRFP